MRRRTPAWLRVVGYVFAVVFIIAGWWITAELLITFAHTNVLPTPLETFNVLFELSARKDLRSSEEALLRQFTAVSSARILFSAIYLPGLFPEEQLNALKHVALAYVDDGLAPLVF